MSASNRLSISQTPNEILDWEINWASRDPDIAAGTDTIVSSVFTVSAPDITITRNSFNTNFTVFWVTGGIPGNIYQITNTITTSGGREMQETVDFISILYRQI